MGILAVKPKSIQCDVFLGRYWNSLEYILENGES